MQVEPSPTHATRQLSRLKERLSDLSMRNRALRLVRLYQKRTFDLAALDLVLGGNSASALGEILAGNGRVQLATMGTGEEEQERLAKGLTYLGREVELLRAERGISDLAVGFPFFCGQVDAERYLQAPLLLFPVQLVRARAKGGLAVWQLDPKRDAGTVAPNRTLLLALKKYGGIDIDAEWLENLADEVVERSTGGPMGVTEAVAAKLRGLGMSVQATDRIWGRSPSERRHAGRLVPLPEYRKDELPATAVRAFELRPHAVVGRFPLADTALTQDFDGLIEMLGDRRVQDLGYAWSLVSGTPLEPSTQVAAPSEECLWPVLPLDESQERVIGRILGGECLAVDGPPGTGKSQMIVNLVAAALARGETVLVVSQKRAALDVVSQRMTEAGLSSAVALVHDPIQDRRRLFEHVRRLLGAVHGTVAREPERARLLEELGSLVGEADCAHQALVREGRGISPFDAYVRRIVHDAPTDAVPVSRLPVVDPAWLDRTLDDLQAYVDAQGRTRAQEFPLGGRRSWAALGEDDRERLRNEVLPGVEAHVDRRRTWEARRTPPVAGLSPTAQAHDVLVALGRLCDAEPPENSPVWSWVRDALDPATAARLEMMVALLDASPAAGSPVWSWVPYVAAPDGPSGLSALRDLARRAPDDSAGAWRWIPGMSESPPEGAWVQAAEADALRVDAMLVLRDAASGRVSSLPPESWGPFEGAAQRWHAARARWYWVFRPAAWGDRGVVRCALRLEGFERSMLNSDVQSVCARIHYARDLGQCARELCVVALTEENLREPSLALRDELEAGRAAAAFADAWLSLPAWCRRGGLPASGAALRTLVADAEAALNQVRRWRVIDEEVQRRAPGVPLRREMEALSDAAVRARELVARWDALMATAPRELRRPCPRSTEEIRAIRVWVSHGLTARELDRERQGVEQALDPWLGARTVGWLDEAVQGRPGELSDRVWGEVSRHFRELVDLDRRCDRIADESKGLAELALSLRRPERPDVRPLLRAAFADRWVRDADADPVLRGVTHAEVSRRQGRLRAVWDELRVTSKGALQARLRQRLAEASPRPKLHQEVSKQRRLWSVRQLVESYWDGCLRHVVPVWLCSPETVAAVFPLQEGVFDLIVFDEASQCPLERAVTVCYRGRVTAVVGDDRQLPPSDLFTAHVADDEAEDGLEDVPQSESLLERAKALRGSALDLGGSLLWHYRSRFPELIEFSNRCFYDGRLRTAPVPWASVEPPVIEWVPIRGEWEHQGNEGEAKATAHLVDRLLEEHADLSLGVITFNREQSSRIQDEIDRLADARPQFRKRWETAMARSLEERPFVRNLENVQGDERDIVILSVAYAPGRSGVLSRNFGILSQQGGERRLNVAISRARWKMAVLCSFSPGVHFPEDGISSEGGRLLRRFLLFAQGAAPLPVSQAHDAGVDVPSDAHGELARSVAGALESWGFQSHSNVGSSLCRVDLAVVDPRAPGRYLLGLLFDGPGAAWAGDARSRELGRWSFLQSYGWSLFGISARSWLREREAVLRQLRTALDEANRAGTGVRTPPAIAPLVPPELLAPCEALADVVREEPTPATSRAPRASATDPSGRATAPRPALPTLRAGIGSVVVYRKVGGDTMRKVCIGGRSPDAIEISVTTPVARALTGAAPGDLVTLSVGDVEHELEVVSVDGTG